MKATKWIATALAISTGMSSCLSGFSGTFQLPVFAASSEPTLNSDGYYEISTAAQLDWFAEEVNSGNTDINGKLTADIVYNDDLLDDDLNFNSGSWTEWTPIGTYGIIIDNGVAIQHTGGGYTYDGEFDGNGYTICGLYRTDDDGIYYENFGLFGCIGENGYVHDVIVTDSYFEFEEVGSVGFVCGKCTSIMSCTVTNSRAEIETSGYLGGVCGYGSYLGSDRIENCILHCDTTKSMGGILGYGHKTGYVNIGSCSVQNCTITSDSANYLGGICGYSESQDGQYGDVYVLGSISNCNVENSTITGDSVNYVGGICGYASSYKIYTDRFTDCTIENSEISGTDSIAVGGICGYIEGGVAGSNGEITDRTTERIVFCAYSELSNCNVTEVSIFRNHYLGGIVGEGEILTSLTDCTVTGTEISTIETGSGCIAGGVVGYLDGTTMDNCSSIIETLDSVISNCTAENTAITADYAGGICGELGAFTVVSDCDNTNDLEGYTCGGIAWKSAGEIQNCTNSGGIYGIKGGNGGIAAISTGIISECENSGDIDYTASGGIVGTSSGEISACWNHGTISDENGGGIVGTNDGSIISCYSIGAMESTTSGSICYENNGEISDCYGLDSVATAPIAADNGTTTDTDAKSDEEFASGEVCWRLNQGIDAWGQEIGVDAYPILDGMTVYQTSFQPTFADSFETYDNGTACEPEEYANDTENTYRYRELTASGIVQSIITLPYVHTEDMLIYVQRARNIETTSDSLTYTGTYGTYFEADLSEEITDLDELESITFSMDTLPDGLELDSETGIISGTPTTSYPDGLETTVTLKNGYLTTTTITITFVIAPLETTTETTTATTAESTTTESTTTTTTTATESTSMETTTTEATTTITETTTTTTTMTEASTDETTETQTSTTTESTTTTNKTTTTTTTTTTSTMETTIVTTETTTTTTREAFETLLGDVNLDGKVTLADSVLLNKAMAGIVTLNSFARQNADVNADGYVDAADALVLLFYFYYAESMDALL